MSMNFGRISKMKTRNLITKMAFKLYLQVNIKQAKKVKNYRDICELYA